jgi:hypothetical protein
MIYHGIVKDGVVVLDEGITLAEGSAVEIYLPDTAPDVVVARVAATLATMGVRVATRPILASAPEPVDRTPAATTGAPVSQVIQESRQ